MATYDKENWSGDKFSLNEKNKYNATTEDFTISLEVGYDEPEPGETLKITKAFVQVRDESRPSPIKLIYDSTSKRYPYEAQSTGVERTGDNPFVVVAQVFYNIW